VEERGVDDDEAGCSLGLGVWCCCFGLRPRWTFVEERGVDDEEAGVFFVPRWSLARSSRVSLVRSGEERESHERGSGSGIRGIAGLGVEVGIVVLGSCCRLSRVVGPRPCRRWSA